MVVVTTLELVKLSELPQTASPQGKWTLATDIGSKTSMALSLNEVYIATNNANAAAANANSKANQASQAAQDATTAATKATTEADKAIRATLLANQAASNANSNAELAEQAARAANEAREGIQEDLTSKASLDAQKKYVEPLQMNPFFGYQTGAIMGKGLFKSSDPAITTDLREKPHTTVVLFTTPSASEVGMKGIYNEGPDNTTGFGTFIWWSNGSVVVSIRGGNYKTTQVPPQTLCMAALSYRNDQAIMAINGSISVAENPPYPYAHNPQRVLVGGTERDSTNGTLATFRAIAVRKFNFAATSEQLTEMWNGGRPEQWRVPDDWRDGRCLLDLVPEGLLGNVWRDMSGNGTDLPYVASSGNPADVVLSYENVGYPDTITGIAAPTVAPNFVGQSYIDTVNKNIYRAVGISTAGDWKMV